MKVIKWIISFITRFANLIAFFTLLISVSASYIHPKYFPILPFFGLILPLTFGINLFFAIIFIIRKRYFALVSLLGIALAIPQILNLFALHIHPKQIAEGKNKLSILTYNVRDFDLYNWSENEHSKELIFETLKEKNANILCFQEFYSDSTKEFNTIQQLENIGYKYHYIAKELTLRKNNIWGIALFSKLPITNSGSIVQQQFLTGYGKKPYKGLFCDIKINDTIMRVLNVHLQSIYFNNEDYETIQEFRETQQLDEDGTKNIFVKLYKAFLRRAEQATVLKSILNTQKQPFVLCGDFNDTPNSFVYNTISKNMKDNFLETNFGIGYTYNGKIPFLRIDYILTTPTINIHKTEKIKNKISDHFPIYTEISW